MALKILHTTGTPLGEFDALDQDLNDGFLGGEVCTWGSVTRDSGDKAAGDSLYDGYVNPNGASTTRRVVSRKANASTTGPLMLSDDGTAGYGTLFGTLVGGFVGQNSYGPGGGVGFGFPSYAATGKITLWSTPGLFGVTLDAVDTTAATGLQPTNTSLLPGAKLYVGAGGLLTPQGSGKVVGYFVDFETSRSLVTSANRMVGSLGVSGGSNGGGRQNQSVMCVFNYVGV